MGRRRSSLGSLAGAVVMLGAFAMWERRAESPMVPPALLRNRRFVAANTVFALMYFSLAGMFFWVTLYFQDLRGWSALETGLSWLLLNGPFFAASLSVSRLARRYDGRLLIGAGSLIAAVGMVGLTLLSSDTGFWLAGMGYLLVGLGFGLAAPSGVLPGHGRRPSCLCRNGFRNPELSSPDRRVGGHRRHGHHRSRRRYACVGFQGDNIAAGCAGGRERSRPAGRRRSDQPDRFPARPGRAGTRD